MTDKKLTDNEIIKAWKCCVINQGCKGCPYKKYWKASSSQCLDMRLKDTFELINRQKAEIEEYEKVVGKLGRKDGKVVCVLKGKETEYIPTSIANVHQKLAISKAKAEAIKEFAERLKAKEAIHFCKCGEPFVYTDLFNGEIYNLVKEMVGDV